MTTEIVVMNREAVAFAADSAVTVHASGRNKVFTSANKIFALSKARPVGIMIFNSALLDGIPWETIIKSYRSHLGNRSFPTLSAYADNFINYLKNQKMLIPRDLDYHYSCKGRI